MTGRVLQNSSYSILELQKYRAGGQEAPGPTFVHGALNFHNSVLN